MRTLVARPTRSLSLATVTGLVALAMAACGGDDSALRNDGDGTAATATRSDAAGSSSSVATTTEEAVDAALVDGHTFRSQSVLVDGTPTPLVAGTTITLTFTAGELQARAGCNSLAGRYRFDGDVLHVEGLGSTAMGCDAALMDQDEWLIGQLTAGPEMVARDETLTLRNGGTEIVLVDELRGAAGAGASLEGTNWVVDTLYEGESASSVPAGTSAGIRIDGSTLTVTGGCNSGGTTVAVDGARLLVDPLVTTQKACGDDAMRVEQHLLVVLGASPMFALEGGKLRLDTGTGRGVGFTAS